MESNVVNCRGIAEETSQTEAGAAERFAKYMGREFRYCKDSKCWMQWDEETGRWSEASISTMINHVKILSDMIEDDIINIRGMGETDKEIEKNEKERTDAARRFVAKLRSARNAKAVLEYVQSAVECNQDDFDSNAQYLGLPDGQVLDLVSQTVVKAERKMLLTKNLAGNIKSVVSEKFMKFIKAIFPDDELRDYVQKYTGSALLGYKLRNASDKNALFMDSSVPDTGKSAFLSMLECAMGDYYKTATKSLICGKEKSGSENDPELAGTVGARIVGISECSVKDVLSTRFKQLTGNDAMLTKLLYKNTFEFRPNYKIILVSNYLPQLRNAEDIAERRRIRRYCFNHTIEETEDDIFKIIEEQDFKDDAITWLVEGCKKYLNEGKLLDDYKGDNLPKSKLPAEMKASMASYFQENDDAGDFITTWYTISEDSHDFVSLLQMWECWIDNNYDRTIKQREFNKNIKDLLSRRYKLEFVKRPYRKETKEGDFIDVNGWGFAGIKNFSVASEKAKEIKQKKKKVDLKIVNQ